MRIKTITAETMPEALSLIRTQLGPEALILETRKVTRNGKPTLEITAAINEDNLAPAQPTKGPRPASPTTSPPEPNALPNLLTTTLTSHGLPENVSGPLLTALPGLKAAGFTEAESLAMLLGKQLTVRTQAEIMATSGVHIFIGPHGAGKTTLISKLAIQARQHGRKIGLLSLDDQKIGGFEPLAIAAEIMGDSAHLITNSTSLHAAAAQLGARSLLLLDTPGINPFAPTTLASLHTRLAKLGLPASAAPATHLVMPANLNPADMQTLPVTCHRFGLTSLAFTKLDCTTRYGAIVATAAASGLPIGLASHSPDLAAAPLSLSTQWLSEALTQLPAHPWEFTADWSTSLTPAEPHR
jgi:flagellar biosynthesis protein FlhF